MIGCGIAFLQASLKSFLFEWYALQGLPLIGLGIFLFLIAQCPAFASRISALTLDGSVPAPLTSVRWARFAIIFAVWSGAILSTAAEGFNASGILLVFMWSIGVPFFLIGALSFSTSLTCYRSCLDFKRLQSKSSSILRHEAGKYSHTII